MKAELSPLDERSALHSAFTGDLRKTTLRLIKKLGQKELGKLLAWLTKKGYIQVAAGIEAVLPLIGQLDTGELLALLAQLWRLL